MGSDVLLAIGHHIAAFTVLATLAAEWALVRPGLSRRDAIQVRVIDAVYGIAAGTVLVIGSCASPRAGEREFLPQQPVLLGED